MTAFDHDAVEKPGEAARVRLEAGAWVERQDGSGLSPDEALAFEEWLTRSMAHRVAYWRADAAWKSANRLRAFKHREQVPYTRSSFFTTATLLRTTAALALIACVAAGAMVWRERPVETTVSTAVGEQKTIALSDGTKIELNTDTALHVTLTAQRRRVELDHGEAYFQVRHDASRPFVVMAAGHKITDLGTKFLVQANSGKLEVTLVEGSARLDTAEAWIQPHSAILAPGDVIVATANSLVRKTKDAKHLAADLGWQQGVLVFFVRRSVRLRMNSIATTIQRYRSQMPR